MNENQIRLVLPAQPEYARIARLAVAGLATRQGFTYDEVEDLRIAVGEVCSVLVAPDGQGQVELIYEMVGNGLSVVATASEGPAAEVNDLSEQILDAVVDEHQIDPKQRRVVLVKHRHA